MKILVTILLILIFTVFPSEVLAKPSVLNHPYIQLKLLVFPFFRPFANTVNVIFVNLKSVSTLNYTLTYESSGVPQGVVGSINPGNLNIKIEKIFLGTCSGNVCSKHTNLRNGVLTVTGKYKNGENINKSVPVGF
ncbi:hypothetical protein HYS97_03515 [Candidatus Daviesbacteria bacterium]|nr:hypothetical protein [Candidatus Daviesbacteria bacterium]